MFFSTALGHAPTLPVWRNAVEIPALPLLVHWGCTFVLCLWSECSSPSPLTFIFLLTPWYRCVAKTRFALNCVDLALHFSAAKFYGHLHLGNEMGYYTINSHLSLITLIKTDDEIKAFAPWLANFSHLLQSCAWNFLLLSVSCRKNFWQIRVKTILKVLCLSVQRVFVDNC